MRKVYHSNNFCLMVLVTGMIIPITGFIGCSPCVRRCAHDKRTMRITSSVSQTKKLRLKTALSSSEPERPGLRPRGFPGLGAAGI